MPSHLICFWENCDVGKKSSKKFKLLGVTQTKFIMFGLFMIQWICIHQVKWDDVIQRDTKVPTPRYGKHR